MSVFTTFVILLGLIIFLFTLYVKDLINLNISTILDASYSTSVFKISIIVAQIITFPN